MLINATRSALIVEDDPNLQRTMSQQLSRMGFVVRSALHYDAALEHLASMDPQLVCVDLELPTRSGYEVCEYIRNSLALPVPILVTSETGHTEEMAFAEQAGANAFLKKPFPMRDLVRYVEALVKGHHRTEPGMWRLRP